MAPDQRGAAFNMSGFGPTKEVDGDGRTVINVWSKGRTPLGRFLSNFTHSHIHHPQYGHFASVEGFWYWLATGKKHDDLRRLYSASAKSAGLKYIPVKMPDEEFRQEIRTVQEIKIRTHPAYLQQFIRSTLPFDHYFVYGDRIVRKERHTWQMEFLEELRTRLRKEFDDLAKGPELVDPELAASTEDDDV